MARIINNTEITFSPSAQQAIRNAAANCGVETVMAVKSPNDGQGDTLFNLFDEDNNYLFSIDLDGDVIFSA